MLKETDISRQRRIHKTVFSTQLSHCASAVKQLQQARHHFWQSISTPQWESESHDQTTVQHFNDCCKIQCN